MKQGKTTIEFALDSLEIKQGRANYKPKTVLLEPYTVNKKLSVIHYLTTYIRRTALLRKEHTRLFLTTRKPFKPASKNSIARWIKNTLVEAGIDAKQHPAQYTFEFISPASPDHNGVSFIALSHLEAEKWTIVIFLSFKSIALIA
jgi:hypothetical protein